GDAETAADALDLTVVVSDSNLLQSISLGGAGSNRSLTITASPSQTGAATVTLRVSDGTTTNISSFQLTVVPALLFADPFSYSDGTLITNATPPWTHHSGTVTGQVQVLGGKVVLSSTLTEDVSVVLSRGPFAANSGAILYVSFYVSFSQLPGSTGDYFAHFNTTAARCRLFANTANAASGKFRLGIANASSTLEQLPMDLSLNTIYFVLVRYEVGVAVSTLWVNPLAETDASASATDAAAASSISSFALREDHRHAQHR
ncbi:MAG TPA: hypothetical protein VK530_06255, partial [Candidatus Acidoferrum sp.]|nr:hypothetical protein [Candidatus Acidoferrum sp.]